MPNLILTTGYVSAIFETAWPAEGVRTATAGLAAELPGGWTSSYPRNSQTAPTVRIRRLGSDVPFHSSASVRADGVLIATVPDLTGRSARIGYVAYALLERARQESRMVTMHASAVVDGSDRAVVLLGDKGSGKTSTLLALVERGFRPLGDDLIVLRLADDGVWVLPGKAVARVRGAARRAGFFYESKTLQTLCLPRSPDAKGFRVHMVARVNVHSAVRQMRVRRLSVLGESELLRLFENLGRYISGVATPLALTNVSVTGRLLGLDTSECALVRTSIINRLSVGPYFLIEAPTPEDLANAIASGLL